MKYVHHIRASVRGMGGVGGDVGVSPSSSIEDALKRASVCGTAWYRTSGDRRGKDIGNSVM